jgi:hypothetical protein
MLLSEFIAAFGAAAFEEPFTGLGFHARPVAARALFLQACHFASHLHGCFSLQDSVMIVPSSEGGRG